VIHQVRADAAAYKARQRKERRQSLLQGSPKAQDNNNEHKEWDQPKYCVACPGEVKAAGRVFDPRTTQFDPRQKETYQNKYRQA